MMPSPRSIMAAMIVLATGCTTGGYKGTSFPGHKWMGDMEGFRIDGPGDPTRIPKHFVIEFGSDVKIRNVRCSWKIRGREAVCDFERQVTPFLGRPGDWEQKSRTYTLDREGRWSTHIEFENPV